MSYNSGSNRARNFKSAEREARGRFDITRPITPWIVLHSVQLLLLIIISSSSSSSNSSIIIIIIIISISITRTAEFFYTRYSWKLKTQI